MADIKQYVNLDPAKPDELNGLDPKRAGKKIQIEAKVKPAAAGVVVCFEIEVGPDNVVKSLDVSNLTAKERAKIKSKLGGAAAPGKARKCAVTGADGKATMEFVLSECGGDVFKVSAYVRDNPGKKLVSDKYIVWRRFYYQVSRFRGGAKHASRPAPTNLPEIPALDLGPVLQEFKDRRHLIEIVKDPCKDLIQRRCEVLEQDDDYKKSASDAYSAKREPLSLRMVLVHQIATSQVAQIVFDSIYEKTPKTLTFPFDLWLDESLPVNTDWLLTLEWKWYWSDPSWKALDPACLRVTGRDTVEINLPDRPPRAYAWMPGAGHVQVRVRYRYLAGSTNGVSWYNAVWIADANMHDGARTVAAKQQTTIHEIGHFLGMVPAGQSTHYVDHGHQGGHCSKGLSGGDLTQPSYRGLSGTCVMFGENATSRTAQFCDQCDPSLRAAAVRLQKMPVSW